MRVSHDHSQESSQLELILFLHAEPHDIDWLFNPAPTLPSFTKQAQEFFEEFLIQRSIITACFLPHSNLA